MTFTIEREDYERKVIDTVIVLRLDDHTASLLRHEFGRMVQHGYLVPDQYNNEPEFLQFMKNYLEAAAKLGVEMPRRLPSQPGADREEGAKPNPFKVN